MHAVPLTSLTIEALTEFEVTKREAERSKNMFALGLMSWLFTRPTEGTVAFLEKKFASKPEIAKANIRAFQAGYAFGETSEAFTAHYEVKPAKLAPGTYRNVTGNQALAMGLVAASVQSGLPLFLGAYPITPRRGSWRSFPATSISASAPSRRKTRSRPSAPRSAHPSVDRSAYRLRAARASS